jgi:hypothetical protein
MREEHRLRMFENSMHRSVSELKREEMSGNWRKLHDENLYSSLHKLLLG